MVFRSGNEKPLVSIITPSYNQGQFLESTIQSVLSQDYDRIEHIIIDGGSTDESVDILRRYNDKISYWVSEKDLGQTDAINKGFDLASGDILAWLNSDDTYHTHAVREAVEYLTHHAYTGMVYGKANYIDEKGKVIGRFPAAQTNYGRLLSGYVHIPQQSSFFRSSIWRMVGPLDTSLFFAMDYALWVKIAAVSGLSFVNRVWANFRIHSNAKTIEAAYRCWPEMVEVSRMYGVGRFSPIYAKYILRRILEPVMPLRMKLRTWLYRGTGQV